MTGTEDRVGGDEGEALLELSGLTRRFGSLEVYSAAFSWPASWPDAGRAACGRYADRPP